MSELPDYYFRVKDNGATVFRVDTENRMQRIEMDPIAQVNTRNGEIKAQGERKLTVRVHAASAAAKAKIEAAGGTLELLES